jgi:hypothetical protein
MAVQAEQAGFSSSLSAENRKLTGLDRLNSEQLAALDAQVSQEISSARQGRTPAFATSFSHRRTPQQRKTSGLDTLMTPELARLDTLIAAQVAAQPTTTALVPLAPARTSDSAPDFVEYSTRKLELHGEIGMTYMAASDGSHGYGGWVETTVSDPERHFSLTVGIDQFDYKDKAGTLRRSSCGFGSPSYLAR